MCLGSADAERDNKMSLARKCAWCLATDVKLFSCAKCCLVTYCGRECQLKHWKGEHRASCSKTQTEVTWRVAAAKPGHTQSVVGDSTPGNISMTLFLKMTKEEQTQAVVDFAQKTRSIRKYKDEMRDASLRWAAVHATSRLVLMCMNIDDWGGANDRLHAFFQLIDRLEDVQPSQAQRDEWGLDRYVESMTKNRCVVQEILLEAEIFATRQRVYVLKPGKNKSEQTYALLERIMLSQQQYAALGPDFLALNVHSRIQVIDTCISFLVDLGCTKEDVNHGVQLGKTFEILDKQLALGFTIFESAVENYPQRDEQFSCLQHLVGVVKRMKEHVQRRTGEKY